MIKHVLLAITVGLLAYFLGQYSNGSCHACFVAEGLLREVNGSTPTCPKVAIAYNTNLDLIVSGTSLLHALSRNESSTAADCEKISDIHDFQSCFQYYFQSGSAAERFVSDGKLFNEFVNAARNLPGHFEHIGGNAGLMASVFASQNCPNSVLLGGPVGPGLRKLLHPKITSETDRSTDEVHLILEYKKGDQFLGFEAPRSNRFIIHHDVTNGNLGGMASFHQSLPEFNPDVVVISGLHLLDGLSIQDQTRKLDECRAHMMQLKDVSVHLELASIGDLKLIQRIAEQIFPVIDSLGLNEQELEAVARAFGEKFSFYSNESERNIPRVRAVADALSLVFDRVRAGRLSRIHFHSLTYHMIVEKEHSGWSRARIACAAASLGVTQRACDIDLHRKDLYDFVDYFEPDADELAPEVEQDNFVSTWRANSLVFHLVPVLVCKNPSKTVGLGDSISATGIQYQRRILSANNF